MHRRLRRPWIRRARSEAGFTLIELLISITVLGSIIGVIGLVFTVSMQNNAKVQSTLPGPRAANTVGLYLSSDVSSAVPVDPTSWLVTDPSATTGCAGGVDKGTNVLRMETRSATDPSTTYVASYRYVPSTTGGTKGSLWRIFCVSGQAPSSNSKLADGIDVNDPPTVKIADGNTSVELLFLVYGRNASPGVVASCRVARLAAEGLDPKDRPAAGPNCPYEVRLRAAVRTVDAMPALTAGAVTTIPSKPACQYSSMTVGTANRSGKNPVVLDSPLSVQVTSNLSAGGVCKSLLVKIPALTSVSCPLTLKEGTDIWTGSCFGADTGVLWPQTPTSYPVYVFDRLYAGDPKADPVDPPVDVEVPGGATSVTVRTFVVPAAPTGVMVVAGNQQLVVSWTAPALTPDTPPITGYTVTATPGPKTCTTTGATTCTLTGLTNGTTYTITVTATNRVGTGPASTPVTGKPLSPFTIYGNVFEDVNYGGGAGRDKATALGRGGSGRPNARVELYEVKNTTATFLEATVTDANGDYSFLTPACSTCAIRAVVASVTSSRTGAVSTLRAVPTFMTDVSSGAIVPQTNMVGGYDPAATPADEAGPGAAFDVTTGVFSAGKTGNAQAFTVAIDKLGTARGVDFGFNFDTVTNTNDTGMGSLRQVLTNANTLGGDAQLAQMNRSAGTEHAVFMISNGSTGSGGSVDLVGGLRTTNNYFTTKGAYGQVATITVASALPTVSAPIVLDARTQQGWLNYPIVELNGAAVTADSGLTLSGGATTIGGLIVNRFGVNGLDITAGSTYAIKGNWIGLGVLGTSASNGSDGVKFGSSVGSGNVVGGTTLAERNVISANKRHGVTVLGGSVTVTGNYVGVDPTGSAALGNAQVGVSVAAAVKTAIIGGTATGEGNVISGNGSHGIATSSGSGTIQGNLIGLNAAGTAAVPNSYGVYVGASGTTIGGTSTAARNVISGNTNHGVWLDGGQTTVVGNFIGTDSTGKSAVANKTGVYVSSSGNSIGGTSTGAGNVISGNTSNGVVVAAGASTNSIRRNSIYANSSTGIDLNGNGVSANDGTTTSTAGNVLTDSPVFTTSSLTGTTLTVRGYVGSAASQSTFASNTVEVFVSDSDISGFGEGQSYLGSVTTDANGNFSGTITVSASAVTTGTKITATATDSNGNTSEFGANRAVSSTSGSITGKVYEDRNYGGGAGRSFSGSSGSAVNGATVELYDTDGIFVTSTTTNASGDYTFASLPSAVYTVRVVDSSVTSGRAGSIAGLLPVLTYRTDAPSGTAVGVTDHVGGTYPLGADASAGSATTTLWSKCAVENATCSFTGTKVVRYGENSTFVTRVLTGGTPCTNTVFTDPLVGVVKSCWVFNGTYQSLATVNVASAAVSGVDFGYNFDTVVNTNDSGQGSLRQMLTNANALTGESLLSVSGRTAAAEHAIFMIPNGTTGSGGSASVTGGMRTYLNAFTTSAGSYNAATITLGSSLPSVTGTMVLDAQTQPGWTSAPIVEVKGANTVATAFTFGAASSAVRGFVLNGFTDFAIIGNAGSLTIQGNYVGPSVTGLAIASPTNTSGILLNSGTGTRIGGTTASTRNVVSGNARAGIWIGGTASSTTVVGNYVGIGADGTTALGNRLFFGMEVYGGGSNTIGGTATGEGNVFSGQSNATKGGLFLASPSNVVQGNKMGTNAAGTAAVANVGPGIQVSVGNAGNVIGGTATGAGNLISGNGTDGVLVEATTTIQGNLIGTNAAGTAAIPNGAAGSTNGGVRVVNGTGTLIGGTTTSARNILSGNGGSGVWLDGGSNTTIQNNYIGTNANGDAAIGNSRWGVSVNTTGASGTQIGGIGVGNVISGNTGTLTGGIYVGWGNTVVEGNRIGLAATGTATIPNGSLAAVWVRGVNNVRVGGSTSGMGNIIAGNTAPAVWISGSATGATVLGNSMYGNTGPGLDLQSGTGADTAPDGVSANDGVKTTGKANLLMDSPVFTSASVSGSTLTVAGYVGTAAGQAAFANSRVEVFVSDNDATGFGEGQTYLGFLSTSTTTGDFSGTITIPGGVTVTPGTTRITGTASDNAANPNTSEFGANATVSRLITGTVFEDVNYGGGAGRSLSASSGVGRSNARVELYSVSGTTATYQSATTTASDGTYSLAATCTSCAVRVVSSSVSSSRTGWTSALLPVPTFMTDASSGTVSAVTNKVGGTSPAATPAGNGAAGSTFNTSTGVFTAGPTGTAQAFALTTSSSGMSGVDFGFNFDTIVNTNDSGAGSLRQWITNASALGGEASLAQAGWTSGIESSIFVLPTTSTGYQSATATWRITPSTQLPTITGSLNVLDGLTQSGAAAGDLWSGTPHTLKVEINGGGAGMTLVVVGGTDNGVRGLVLGNVNGSAVSFTGTRGSLRTSYVGLTTDGTTATAVNGNSIDAGGTVDPTIGGSGTGDGNVIAGNGPVGIASANGISGLSVVGNFLGSNATGTAIRGSFAWGAINNYNGTGTWRDIRRNLVVGAPRGIAFDGDDTISGTVAGKFSIAGNYIGVGRDGVTPLANGVGIRVDGYPTGLTIGGPNTADANVISGNTGAGIAVSNNNPNIRIQQNTIWGNGGLGIDLGENGVTTNDGAKSAGSPNQFMDQPVFTSATVSGTTVNLVGYVGSAAGQTAFASARVEVFVSSSDASGYGEGQTYLGFVTTDASGNINGSVTVPSGVNVTIGTTKITGTATDSTGNTSEFGPNATVGRAISGTVFEDVNYGGGAGRSMTAASGVARPNARVEIYSVSGTTATFVSATTTASDGTYSVPAACVTCAVRVVGSSVLSSRSGATSALLPVPTFVTDATSGAVSARTDYVGGTLPSGADGGNGTTNTAFNTSTGAFTVGTTGYAQSFTVVGGSGPVSGIDFGFNFDTVVNTNDSGAGSLRQVITNANTLTPDTGLAQQGRTGAVDNVIFMIPNGTTGTGGSLSLTGGLRSSLNSFTTAGGVATITPATSIPAVTTTMVIDAQTQPGWTANPLVEIRGDSAGLSNGLTLNASNVVLRGVIVNRFSCEGITSTSGNAITVQGVWSGLDSLGTTRAGNGCSALWMNSTGSNHVIGGTTATQRNVFSGSTNYEGVAILGGSGHTVVGNYIGTNYTGTATITNGGQGIKLYSGVTASTIGGSATGAGNLIVGSGGNGIQISGASTITAQNNTIYSNGQTGIWVQSGANNKFLSNSIYGNTGLGIDLGTTGVLANDGVLTAGQPNQNVDSPVITTAGYDGVNLNVAGYVGSAAGQAPFANSRVEFFVADGDASGSGEGRTYIGFVNTGTTNGTFSGSIVVPGGVTITPGTTKITATATDSANDTSEFGVNVTSTYSLSISGTVFDDVNYGGGAGRPKASASGWMAASNGASRATVELYNGTGTLVTTTTAAADGTYSFSNLTPGNYQVRLVVGTTPSGRTGWTSGLAPVLTYRVDGSSGSAVAVTDRVGGETPSLVDAAANSGAQTLSALTSASATAQAVAPVTLSTGAMTLVDFGVSFDAVTSVRDSGAGSLRQAITNANALTGDTSLLVSGRTAAFEHLIFMLPNGTTGSGGSASVTGGLRAANNVFTTAGATQNVATYLPTTALPTITSALFIDAQAQPGWTLNPIVELRGSSMGVVGSGLTITGSNVTVRGLIVNRFTEEGILSTAGNSITIEGNWVGINALGTGAAGSANGGVYFNSTGSNHRVGGTTAQQRNVLSSSTRFEGVAFEGGSGHVVSGNYIGTDYTGTLDLGNNTYGVWFGAPVQSSTVGGTATGAGNVISGNGASGVDFNGPSITVQGNEIGTNAAGTASIPNARGISMTGGTNAVIGGTTSAAANIISGNGINAIEDNTGIYVSASTNVSIAGNTIGLGMDGTTAVPNARSGIYIVGVSTVTVGGNTTASRNIISGNGTTGVLVGNISTGSVTVQNNWIGLAADGSTARANGTDGVQCATATANNCAITSNVISSSGRYGVYLGTGTGHNLKGNFIGTDSAGAVARPNVSGGVYVAGTGVTATIGSANSTDRNIISGNGGFGVRVDAAGAVSILGNYIGVAANGTSALGNSGPGVSLLNTSSSTVGSLTSGAGNIIANNTGAGVTVGPTSGSGNSISGNSIYGNSLLGIDLGTTGVTANDGARTTGAANLLTDSPVITTATMTSTQITLSGYVGSAAGQSLFANNRVEVFVTDNDTSGFGEGRTYLGTFNTGTTNGNFSGTLTIPNGVTVGAISATATDTSNNTSEFGRAYGFVSPVTSGLVVALDAANLTTMYQLSGGTSAVTGSGQSVCRWSDTSGVNNHALQTTSAMCPVYGSDSTGGFVNFTANGWLRTAPTLSPDMSVFVVAQSNTSTWNTYGWLASARGASGFIFHAVLGGTTVEYYPVSSGSGYTFVGSVAPTPTGLNLYEMTMTGSGTVSGFYGLNGAVTAYSTTGVTRAAGAVPTYFGADDPSVLTGRNGNGKFREVLMYNRALSVAERQSVETYLRNKWGTP